MVQEITLLLEVFMNITNKFILSHTIITFLTNYSIFKKKITTHLYKSQKKCYFLHSLSNNIFLKWNI